MQDHYGKVATEEKVSKNLPELEGLLNNLYQENSAMQENAHQIYHSVNELKNIRRPEKESEPQTLDSPSTFVDKLRAEINKMAKMNNLLRESKEALSSIVG